MHLRQSSVICIVISMLVKSPPYTCDSFHHICHSVLHTRKAVSLFWEDVDFLSLLLSIETSQPCFPWYFLLPVMVLAQTVPAASCYSPVLKITEILGETSYIIHGFDLLISPLSQKMTFLLAAFQSALS